MNTKDRVTELCRAKGISIPQLEREIGLGKSAINKWAVSMPNTEKLIKVADYFGVSVDSLLGRTTSSQLHHNFNATSVGTESQKSGQKVGTEWAQVAEAYDAADEVTKEMVRRILGIKKEALAGSVG